MMVSPQTTHQPVWAVRTSHAPRVAVATSARLRFAGRRLGWRVHAGVPVKLSAARKRGPVWNRGGKGVNEGQYEICSLRHPLHVYQYALKNTIRL